MSWKPNIAIPTVAAQRLHELNHEVMGRIAVEENDGFLFGSSSYSSNERMRYLLRIEDNASVKSEESEAPSLCSSRPS